MSKEIKHSRADELWSEIQKVLSKKKADGYIKESLKKVKSKGDK